MINTPFGHATRADGYELRLEAVKHGVTHVTNLAGAQAMVAGMEVARDNGLTVVALQDLPQRELGGGTGVSASRKGRRAGTKRPARCQHARCQHARDWFFGTSIRAGQPSLFGGARHKAYAVE